MSAASLFARALKGEIYSTNRSFGPNDNCVESYGGMVAAWAPILGTSRGLLNIIAPRILQANTNGVGDREFRILTHFSRATTIYTNQVHLAMLADLAAHQTLATLKTHVPYCVEFSLRWIAGVRMPPPWKQSLSPLRELRFLTVIGSSSKVQQCGINDDFFAAISVLTDLRELEIELVVNDVSSPQALAKITEIKSLRFFKVALHSRGQQVGPGNALVNNSMLTGMQPSASSAAVFSTAFADVNDNIKSRSNIHRLDIGGSVDQTFISPASGKSIWSAFPVLVELSIRNSTISSAVIDTLPKLPYLNTINLDNIRGTPRLGPFSSPGNLKGLVGFGGLMHLQINKAILGGQGSFRSRITPELLQNISQLPDLQTLEFLDPDMPLDVDAVADCPELQFPKLRKFVLGGGCVQDVVSAKIADLINSMPNVEVLEVPFDIVTPPVLSQLRCSALTHLGLRCARANCSLGAESMKKLLEILPLLSVLSFPDLDLREARRIFGLCEPPEALSLRFPQLKRIYADHGGVFILRY